MLSLGRRRGTERQPPLPRLSIGTRSKVNGGTPLRRFIQSVSFLNTPSLRAVSAPCSASLRCSWVYGLQRWRSAPPRACHQSPEVAVACRSLRRWCQTPPPRGCRACRSRRRRWSSTLRGRWHAAPRQVRSGIPCHATTHGFHHLRNAACLTRRLRRASSFSYPPALPTASDSITALLPQVRSGRRCGSWCPTTSAPSKSSVWSRSRGPAHRRTSTRGQAP